MGRSSAFREHGPEEGSMCERSEELGGNWCAAGEKSGQVCAPRLVHDQDALEAGDESWQEGSLRKGCHGQSQASKDCGEGVPRLCIEESFLSSCSMCQSPACCPWRKHAECTSGVVLGSSCALSLYIMGSR